ncbi:hypothetical protein C2S53_008169 [Perilla frutescens var. hirtella]|uniref:DUF3741 domain-containing protein n=1 Tax=Perilla frutescens var. hirtella TaxID=608512 RepID=A0AAD4PBA9_PERFH|nr:hypothetical protein C2S53_008169 [Perilla frutescens var. hirtella]
MLKRQESSLSASRRQASAGTTPPPPETHHAKAIGCMSGIIKLFSKYQNSNRRLTFGKKQEKRKPPSPARSAIINAANNSPSSAEDDCSVKHTSDTNRLTCAVKVRRSPTLPPEIRRSNAETSPENSRTPSSLVARLMGLEDLGSAMKRPGLIAENTITEKRQRLLQALEKCNDDLEALKKIIKAVQTADVRVQPPLSPPAAKGGHTGNGNGAVQPCMKMCTEEKPNIPVDELTRSPVSSYCVVLNSTTGGMRVPQQRKPTAAKKPGEDEEAIARVLTKSTIIESSLEMRRRAAAAAASPPWSSRAMVESVEEVCNDIAWGEKREIGRIGLVVQDHVCRELIEELVKDLKSCSIIQPLPLEACKRRLCFS